MTSLPEYEDDLEFRFAVWLKSGTEADTRAYYASTARQAAEQRARDDYPKTDDRVWPIAYSVRDNQTGQLWSVLVGIVSQPSFVALEADEIQLPSATHVLWGGHVLCEDLRLRGVPRDWPEGQCWSSLQDVADGAEAPPDRCEACFTKASGLVAGIRQIGKSE